MPTLAITSAHPGNHICTKWQSGMLVSYAVHSVTECGFPLDSPSLSLLRLWVATHPSPSSTENLREEILSVTG